MNHLASGRDPADEAFERSLALVLQPAGYELLATLPPYREQDALALGARLRAVGHDPALVAAVLTLVQLLYVHGFLGTEPGRPAAEPSAIMGTDRATERVGAQQETSP